MSEALYARPSDTPSTFAEAVRVFFRHWSPRILTVLATVAVAIRLSLGDWVVWDAVIALAIIVAWPFQEWCIHVFFLHWKPRMLGGRRIDFPTAKDHRDHHKDPWFLPLLFIPVRVYSYAIVVVAAFWYLIMPNASLTWTGIACMWLGSLHYEWGHYIAHIRYRPRSVFYRRMIDHHRLHHFKHEKYWMGVTTRMADIILGTRPPPDSVETSPTVRDFGYDQLP